MRVNISMSETMLSNIDRIASVLGVTRSALIAAALLSYISSIYSGCSDDF